MHSPTPSALKRPLPYLAYIGAIGLAIVGVGFAGSHVVNASTGLIAASGERQKSPLDLQFESAREIRAALAKPIAGPAPLGPLVSRAHRGTSTMSSDASPPAMKPARHRDAMNAMAMGDYGIRNSVSQSRGGAAVAYDRHRVE